MINRFIGKYKAFSNFEPSPVRYENLTYPTVEHAFVASKSLDRSFRKQIVMMPANKAGQAKKWGRTINLRTNWDEIKIGIMKELLIQKFEIYPLGIMLLDTKDQLIVEGNFWHDNYWGNCLCDKCIKIKGENNLGLLLMQIREYHQLKDEGFFNLEITS